MSEKKPPPPASKPSGEHPAVKSFRAKMESISDGETASTLAGLDASLEKYLKDTNDPPATLREPIPPVCVIVATVTVVCALGTNGCDRDHEE